MHKLLANFNEFSSKLRSNTLQVTNDSVSGNHYLINDDNDPKASIQVKRYRLLKDYNGSWCYDDYYILHLDS
ncbi:unnamed protein product [Thelazia callipaeda]|uniref:SH3 domain-containing protein n=1 Tax=Thelazia callipaeda TaxID=103827 RepID=A0A0N5D9Q3_THECL|nr:unnamed protein product [Thelazia callipaeda]